MVGILAALIMLAVMHGCATAPSPAASAPSPAPTVEIPAPVPGKGCADYSWKDRGKAPIGFFNGMIQSYRIARCTPTAASGPISDKICNSKKGYYCDALKNYKMTSGNELLKTYTFLIGLALRESSGTSLKVSMFRLTSLGSRKRRKLAHSRFLTTE